METCDAPIQAADLSFGHWVASTEDDEDTASSNSASSKAARCVSPTAEESLMVRTWLNLDVLHSSTRSYKLGAVKFVAARALKSQPVLGVSTSFDFLDLRGACNSLQCDEEIGECTQPPSKRQRKSCEFNSNNSTTEPSTGLGKDLSWLLNNSMQVCTTHFQTLLLCNAQLLTCILTKKLN